MGISKDRLSEKDVYLSYAHEEVLFRYEAGTRRFFRKFYGESGETEVPHDNNLLNEALRFGDETDAAAYLEGHPRN